MLGYNIQTAVDSENGMIVDFQVNNHADDKGNLFSLSEQAKEILDVETLTVLADKGYYDGQDIAKCKANGPALNNIECWIVAKPTSGGRKSEEKVPSRN